MRLSDDNLRGRTIIAADGQVVGEIAILFLDCEAWRVESLQVKLGKDIADKIGSSAPSTARCWSITPSPLACHLSW